MYKLSIYSPLASQKKEQYPISPFVHLSIDSRADENGRILLTAQLMTDKEVDEAVDSFIRELEEIRQEAKKRLRSLQSKQLAK